MESPKAAFNAAIATSTDVGDLYKGTTWINSNGNSQTYGYAFGGYGTPAAYLNEIQKWAYASNSNSTDVGDMIYTGNSTNCCSSQTHGYSNGGGTDGWGSGPFQNVIQKFQFSTDGDATDYAEDHDVDNQDDPYAGYIVRLGDSQNTLQTLRNES